MNKLFVGILLITLLTIPVGLSLVNNTGRSSNIQPEANLQKPGKPNPSPLLNNSHSTNNTLGKSPNDNSTNVFTSTSEPLENLTRIRKEHAYTTTSLIGNFTGSNEYEYVMVSWSNDTLIFYNLTSDSPYATYNDTYSSSDTFVAMATAQLDADSYDELAYLNTSGYLYLIDNDLTTIAIIHVVSTSGLDTWSYYPFMKVADINGDGIDDIVLGLRDSSYYYLIVVDGATRSVVSMISTTTEIAWYTIGNFNVSQGLEIAVSYWNGSVVVYDNTLSRLTNTTFTYTANVMATISNPSWKYNALVLLFSNDTNNFDIYNASTFQSMGYNDTINKVSFVEPVVGDLTGDSISDVIVPTLFPDGYGITIYDLARHSIINKIKLIRSDTDYIQSIKLGKITADNRYDILFVSWYTVLLFKGVDNPDTDIQFVRKIDVPDGIYNVFIAQFNGGLNDIFIDSYFYLYIYPTDSLPPRLENLHTNPLRPTIEDGMFSLLAEVIDESSFDDPTVVYNFTTFEGVRSTTDESVSMIKASHTGNQYITYFFNLQAGVYTYKIILRDLYDNQIVYDNNGTLYNVTIYTSNIYHKKVQDSVSASKYAMAVGNLDNDAYSDVVIAGDTNTTVVWGNNTESIALSYNPISSATVYLGSFDNIAGDDIALMFFNSSNSMYQINVYNGSTFTLIQNYSFATNITMVKIGDLTGDGFSELIVATESSTSPNLNNLYIIDVFHNKTLQMYTNLPKISHILVCNVSNDEYMDLAMLLVSEATHTLNLTVITGGSSASMFKTLYSFNSTYATTDIQQNFLFFDNFLSVTEKQFLIINTYAYYYPDIYVINGANGTQVNPADIPYGYIYLGAAGLTVIDANYDGLKDLAYLGYDKSLNVVNLVTGSVYSVATGISSTPFASYWVNMDEEAHKDLVYVTSTGLYIFSPYTYRAESVTYPFRSLASVGVGNFFQLPFSDACTLSVDGILEKYININTFYRLNVNVQLRNDTIPEGDYIDATVNVKNVFNDSITTASILGIFKHNTTIVQVSSFISLKNGTYVLTQTLNNLPMGNYNLSILVSESYYGTFSVSHNLTLLGEIVPSTEVYSPENVYEPVYVNVTLVDQYGFPVFDANITAVFANNTYQPIEIWKNSYFFAFNKADLKVGVYTASFNVTYKYAVESISFNSSVTIITEPKVEFAGNGITRPPVIQGQPMNLKVTLRDATNHTLTGGTITATFFGKIYTFSDLGNGTYVTSIITQNIPGGKWPLAVQVTHPYLTPKLFAGNITIYGYPKISYQIKPVIITQNSNMTLNITVVDLYGYQVTNASVTITFMNRTYMAENIRDNLYLVTIPIGKVPYGPAKGHILVQSEDYKSHGKDFIVFIYPEIPKLELSPMALLSLFGVSIVVSFLGLGLYYYISSKLTKSFSYDERGRLVMSFKSLDRAYFAFVGFLLVTLTAAETLFIIHAYELSVATLGLVLLEVLLLHGIWLYRDTATSMIEEQLPLKRTLIGFWHIVFAPLVILLIFAWGRNIDWFAYYLLESVTNIGGLKLPSLYLSLMGTYVTSVIVLVINIYLNSRRYVRRFGEMRAGGTPENVINDEKIIQLDRMSSSIRLKFLVFLGILGASIVSTATPLLQFYQLGVVVIIPLVIVIVIPYLISQLLKFLGIAKRVTKKIATPVMGPQGPSSSQ